MKLTNAKLTAMVAVSNLEKAKEFYGGTLGLTQSEENPAGAFNDITISSPSRILMTRLTIKAQ